MPGRTFRPYDQEQIFLLPPSLREWLPADHRASVVADLVEDLDLKPILTTYGGVTRGSVPYDPRMLVAVLLYAYAVGGGNNGDILNFPARGGPAPFSLPHRSSNPFNRSPFPNSLSNLTFIQLLSPPPTAVVTMSEGKQRCRQPFQVSNSLDGWRGQDGGIT
ncbi:MAG: hypothetical protein Q8N04_12400 [Nitrospira sp.]|nr:hypothetical protein [Nitrospira sp.]